VNICCNVLIVQGSKREENHPGQINYHCLERHFGRFFRTVEIPPDVDLDAVAARYEAGVLEVVFPRVKGKRMFIREIPIE
jgi:HSP20 family protein